MYLYVKALHIIFVVTWFAGMFYIVRLFIYGAEANEEEGEKRRILLEQMLLMQRRLWYGITWPSAVLTLILGSWMYLLFMGNAHIPPIWLIWKLGFVVLLYLYHYLCHRIFKQQQAQVFKYSSQQLRIWNEVATIFLVAIVFLVVLKQAMSMLYGLIGIVVLTIVILVFISIYKKIRNNK